MCFLYKKKKDVIDRNKINKYIKNRNEKNRVNGSSKNRKKIRIFSLREIEKTKIERKKLLSIIRD